MGTMSEWDSGKKVTLARARLPFFFWVTWLSLHLSRVSSYTHFWPAAISAEILTHAKPPPSIIRMTIPRSRVELFSRQEAAFIFDLAYISLLTTVSPKMPPNRQLTGIGKFLKFISIIKLSPAPQYILRTSSISICLLLPYALLLI